MKIVPYPPVMNWARIRRVLHRLARLTRRPVRDQWLALKAYGLLGHSRFMIKQRGLTAIEPLLGSRMAESPTQIPVDHQERAAKISWAVLATRHYTPWVSNCFPQALAAKRLLATEGIDCTVYFGAVMRAPEAALVAGAPEVGAFAAHAWVRVGEQYITGGDVRELYEPMVWFS